MTPTMFMAPTVSGAVFSGSRSMMKATRVGTMPTPSRIAVGRKAASSGRTTTSTSTRVPPPCRPVRRRLEAEGGSGRCSAMGMGLRLQDQGDRHEGDQQQGAEHARHDGGDLPAERLGDPRTVRGLLPEFGPFAGLGLVGHLGAGEAGLV